MTDYDAANEYGYRVWNNRVDAQGREDWRRVTDDRGAVDLIDFDQANQRFDYMWSNYTDAKGREDWKRTTMDNGDVHWIDYDQANESGTRSEESYTTADGFIEWVKITHDSGFIDYIDFNKPITWFSVTERQVTVRTDAQGREYVRDVIYTDGSRTLSRFDPANRDNYQVMTIKTHPDRNGTATTVLDNGEVVTVTLGPDPNWI